MPLTLLSLIILGLIFGSLGSVIFFRLGELPTRKTLKGFLLGRSHCRHCKHTLHTRDLIPLRSFFSQWGKCRYCKTKLSRRYPTLEIGTVTIFLATLYPPALQDQLTVGRATPLSGGTIPVEYRLLAFGLWLLFLIALYDLKKYELHLTASIFLLLLSFLGQRGLGYNLLPAVQGMLIFFLAFLLVYFGAKRYVHLKYKQKAEWFGFGDVILAGILGSIFPIFLQVSWALERVYLLCTYTITSCILGIALYGILCLYFPPSEGGVGEVRWWVPLKEKSFESPAPTIPFIPAMSVAFILFLWYGDALIGFLVRF